ncbi:MAG: hypothetical protein M3Y84_01310 [Acidobacteriota bacterium]|nr:hypothetical protein [Acidobacteriota bacterium]
MKKKTTITTEKHEVWIIRQPSGQASKQEIETSEPEPSSTNSVVTMLDGISDQDTPPEQEQN